MDFTISINGVSFLIINGKVSNCSDWTQIWDLTAAGHFEARDGGPGTYGHVDFIYKGSI